MHQLTVDLTDQQRVELVRTRDRDHRAYLRECAAALLKVADGQSARQVALSGLNKPRQADTVYRWLSKYKSGGIAALVHKQRGHRGFSPSAGGSAKRTDPPTP
ncbi:MAG: helix-turn-helix domain-containing protein [Chloroflexia bacterium]